MSGFSLKTLAEDLLSLEINTIIKADMTGNKMPTNRREALLKIYKSYNVKLIELRCREPVIWESAGLMGFLELRERARFGLKANAYQLEHTDNLSELVRQDIRENLIMLQRIKGQCEQVITVFVQLAEDYLQRRETAQNDGKPLTKEKPVDADIPHIPEGRFNLEQYRERMAERVGSAEVEDFYPFDEASYPWNNDLPRNKMHMVPDLALNATQLSLLRKISEIGTERIVMQTVIHADGDVTTRIAERLVYQPNETLFAIHNRAVDNAVQFWGSLVDTIARMASSLFRGSISAPRKPEK